MKNKNSIIFSAIAWERDRKKFLEVTQIEDVLLASIDLKKYGEGIQKIIFVPMGVEENDPFHSEYTKFNSRSKKLEIYKRLPVDNLSELSIEVFLQETAQLFYHNIVQELTKRKIKNFDNAAFIKAVEKLFIKKGWLAAQKVSQ